MILRQKYDYENHNRYQFKLPENILRMKDVKYFMSTITFYKKKTNGS